MHGVNSAFNQDQSNFGIFWDRGGFETIGRGQEKPHRDTVCLRFLRNGGRHRNLDRLGDGHGHCYLAALFIRT